jgi:hypothetical protein
MVKQANGLVVVAMLLLGAAAHADQRERVERPSIGNDGSVRLGAKVFPTREAFYRSTEFRESGARCGSHQRGTTAMRAVPTDCTMDSTTINPEYADARVFVIQVVFHVIKKTDGIGDISPELIQSQIDILNEDFAALPGTPGAMGTNTQFQFVLAKFDPQGSPTTGIEYVTSDAYFADSENPNPMKVALHWDTTRYLNIYTNDAQGFLGYATFPQEEAGGIEDGVVLLWDSVGRNSPGGPPYDQGRTATHEIGHYLGLLHTFQDGCGTATSPYTTGDRISDTAPERRASFECVVAESACQGAGVNPIENYMNYTDDVCMTKFTVEQANRMRCSLVNYRTINTAPTAAFSFTVNTRDVSFTNTSMDLETQATDLHYVWTFGDGETSTDANPTHVYASDGTYQVTLEVIDPGSGTATSSQALEIVPSAPDAGAGGGDSDGGDGGGCCQAPRGGTTFVLCALPVVLVLRRRRRA